MPWDFSTFKLLTAYYQKNSVYLCSERRVPWHLRKHVCIELCVSLIVLSLNLVQALPHQLHLPGKGMKIVILHQTDKITLQFADNIYIYIYKFERWISHTYFEDQFQELSWYLPRPKEDQQFPYRPVLACTRLLYYKIRYLEPVQH